jgi:NTP pyrophosphatase (non-canonical NTP hydrolase)
VDANKQQPTTSTAPADQRAGEDRSGPVDLRWYQQAAASTGGPISVDHPMVYPTLGLTSEAGEVAGKVKKIFRDRGGVVTDEDREALTLELGDVLWYLAELCTRLDISLEDVATANIDKLQSRLARGMLAGDGDTR